MPRSHSGPGGRISDAERAGRLAGATKRSGAALVVAAVPAVAVTLFAGVVGGSTSVSGWIGEALATPVLAPGGVAWAFHVATLAALVGVWLVGLALVVEGLLGAD